MAVDIGAGGRERKLSLVVHIGADVMTKASLIGDHGSCALVARGPLR